MERENSLEKERFQIRALLDSTRKLTKSPSKIMNVSWENLLSLEDSHVKKIHDIKGFGCISCCAFKCGIVENRIKSL